MNRYMFIFTLSMHFSFISNAVLGETVEEESHGKPYVPSAREKVSLVDLPLFNLEILNVKDHADKRFWVYEYPAVKIRYGGYSNECSEDYTAELFLAESSNGSIFRDGIRIKLDDDYVFMEIPDNIEFLIHLYDPAKKHCKEYLFSENFSKNIRTDITK